MLPNKKLKYLIVILAAIIIGIIVANKLPKGYETRYEACRELALHRAGYDIWRYKGESPYGSSPIKVTILFDDGTNTLACTAYKIGFLWYADENFSPQTILGIPCPDNSSQCPKIDYHGVSP